MPYYTNRTLVTEFVLLGFSKDFRTNRGLFVMFLFFYLVAVFGNCLILCIILRNPQLQIPMYFFLCILSIVDLCISTSAMPRLLYDLLTAHKVISIGNCTIQFFSILYLGGTESLLLALMAYDRFLAISHPLHYPIQMRLSICYRLTAFLWIISFIIFIIPPLFMPMALCNPNHINHFMCEVLAVIQLACESIFLSELVMLITCFIALFLPFMFVIVSYVCIISSVLKLQSTGRSKAFSTCTSHITVVGKYLSLFSYTICPALNPIIYSLNNKEVKEAIHKLFSLTYKRY
uniref:Olfactory receptor n=1 Tax=Pyxicephalus adspersus TaxID=30357 RepID=A0AAV3AS91_PYXAD|nr:TPA: hypothetical protein GDO54_009915 [Pyxicephalus adspersus]